MKIRIFASLIILCFAQNSIAAEKLSFQAVGFGISSCGKYVNSPKGGVKREMMLQWAYGFLTAKSETAHSLYADEEKGYLDEMDADSIEVYIEAHCSKNPLDNFYTAVNKLDYEYFQKHKE